MAVSRGVVLVLTIIVLACMVSLSGLLIIYLLVTREPAVPSRATLVIRLSGELAEGSPDDDGFGALLGTTRRPTVRAIVENLRKARRDPRIAAVRIMPSGLQAPYWAKLQEVRDAIVDFRKSGKPAVAFLEYGGDKEYFVATGCDRIFMVPSSPLDVAGTATYEMFLRGTLDKIGAVPDMHHIGEYKTATNQLTQKEFTPAHREMDESLNGDMFDQLVRAIADGRKKSPADVRSLIDEGPFLPEDAVRAGLVDDLVYEDQVDDKMKTPGRAASPTIDFDDYSRVGGGQFTSGPRIAVLYASGVISSGRSGYDPTAGNVIGSETLIESIRKLRADPSIRAIVLRIDSPGGSSVASDVIWRELVLTRDANRSRPLVVSMSDLAASGGYYIAAAAPTIVAEPGTLTGSIGIYGGKIVIGGTLSKLGVTTDSVSRGRNAEMDSTLKPFTPEQRTKLEEQLQAFYDQFVEKVAQARHMTAERVDELGQGRVWTGQQAKQIGLVDALGGLDKAIALAKQSARIPADSDVQLVTYPPRRSLYDLVAGQFGFSQRTLYAAALGELAGSRPVQILAAPLIMFGTGEPLALMPAVAGR